MPENAKASIFHDSINQASSKHGIKQEPEALLGMVDQVKRDPNLSFGSFKTELVNHCVRRTYLDIRKNHMKLTAKFQVVTSEASIRFSCI